MLCYKNTWANRIQEKQSNFYLILVIWFYQTLAIAVEITVVVLKHSTSQASINSSIQTLPWYFLNQYEYTGKKKKRRRREKCILIKLSLCVCILPSTPIAFRIFEYTEQLLSSCMHKITERTWLLLSWGMHHSLAADIQFHLFLSQENHHWFS